MLSDFPNLIYIILVNVLAFVLISLQANSNKKDAFSFIIVLASCELRGFLMHLN